MQSNSPQKYSLFAPIDPNLKPFFWLLSLILSATILAALSFQYYGGYIPCKLCLSQRDPYYFALPFCFFGLVSIYVKNLNWMVRGLAAIIGCLMLFGLTLSIFHAGVEWHFWAGPPDCGAVKTITVDNTKDLLAALKTTKAPSCDAATWRLLGLSFAGWNAVISLILSGLAAYLAFHRSNK